MAARGRTGRCGAGRGRPARLILSSSLTKSRVLTRLTASDGVSTGDVGCDSQELGSPRIMVGWSMNPAPDCILQNILPGIAQLASRAGAILHPYTAVTAIERVAGGFSVRTIRGEIRARDVLIATNGYTGDAFPEFQRRVIPISSYIIATERLDPAVAQRIIPKDRMIIDTKHVLYYFRRTADDRLLFGGRASFAPTSVERGREILERAIAKVYPDLKGVRVENTRGRVTSLSLLTFFRTSGATITVCTMRWVSAGTALRWEATSAAVSAR